jgi:hypothetical protein
MKTTDFKTLKDEQKTADWLKANGISEKQFAKDDIWLLKAQLKAQEILKNKIEQLNDLQQDMLRQFYFKATDSNKRNGITKRMCYKVLNIEKQLKRKDFVASKKLAKARRAIKAKRQATT